jgi:hypothetical protein
MDAYEMSEDDKDMRRRILRRTEEYFLKPELETRAAFDEFVVDMQRTRSALAECEEFIARIKKLKLRYIADDTDRQKLREALEKVRILCLTLDASLGGGDDPEAVND